MNLAYQINESLHQISEPLAPAANPPAGGCAGWRGAGAGHCVLPPPCAALPRAKGSNTSEAAGAAGAAGGHCMLLPPPPPPSCRPANGSPRLAAPLPPLLPGPMGRMPPPLLLLLAPHLGWAGVAAFAGAPIGAPAPIRPPEGPNMPALLPEGTAAGHGCSDAAPAGRAGCCSCRPAKRSPYSAPPAAATGPTAVAAIQSVAAGATALAAPPLLAAPSPAAAAPPRPPLGLLPALPPVRLCSM